MAINLSKSYTARFGAPSISQVDPVIFRLRTFAACMAHPTCLDRCCSWGVDIDAANMERLFAHSEALESATGIPKERWFEPEIEGDHEYPSGRVGRTRAENGACVFLDRLDRGCLIHRYAASEGLDVFELKPMMSSLFPLSFSGGVLLASDEAEEGSLFCSGEGVSLYKGSRGVLLDLFGPEFVAELDDLEKTLPASCEGQ